MVQKNHDSLSMIVAWPWKTFHGPSCSMTRVLWLIMDHAEAAISKLLGGRLHILGFCEKITSKHNEYVSENSKHMIKIEIAFKQEFEKRFTKNMCKKNPVPWYLSRYGRNVCISFKWRLQKREDVGRKDLKNNIFHKLFRRKTSILKLNAYSRLATMASLPGFDPEKKLVSYLCFKKCWFQILLPTVLLK